MWTIHACCADVLRELNEARFLTLTVLRTDYTGNPPPYGETPVLDFIWDSNLQIVRKGGWSWDKLPDGYPPTTQVGVCVVT
jgi:hypothetical protein